MRGWKDKSRAASRDSEIREPGHVPRLLACQCDAVSRVSRLLAVAVISAYNSRMAALTRCARIMHRRALATTRPKALRRWRVFRNNGGSTHGGIVAYTTGGRGQMPAG
jgi:hypothetical protein